MTDKLPVKEHLRNSALYQPATEPSIGEEWRHQLLRQYNTSRQINAALKIRTGMLKWSICIGVPVVLTLFVCTIYFGFIQPGDWIEKIGPIEDWNIPPIGLKEVLIFVVAVNGLTFLTRKRTFSFLN